MKTVTYHGPPQRLGRFGEIQEGAVLQMLEREWEGVKDDPDFVPVRRPRPPGGFRPLGCPSFDLRLLPWDDPKIEQRLAAQGKTTLRNIAQAMAEMGMDVVVTVHDGVDMIVDAVVTEARLSGWDKLDRHARAALGTLSEREVAGDIVTVPEDEDGETGEPEPVEPEQEAPAPRKRGKASGAAPARRRG